MTDIYIYIYIYIHDIYIYIYIYDMYDILYIHVYMIYIYMICIYIYTWYIQISYIQIKNTANLPSRMLLFVYVTQFFTASKIVCKERTRIRPVPPFQYLQQFIRCIFWCYPIIMSFEDFCIITRISHYFFHASFFFLRNSLDVGWRGLPKVIKKSEKSWVTISDLCAKYA